MLRYMFVIICAGLVCLAAPVLALAQLDVTVFEAMQGNSWFTEANWDPAIPDETMRAVILEGEDCIIPTEAETEAEAGELVMQGDSTLLIEEEATLILGDTEEEEYFSFIDDGAVMTIGEGNPNIDSFLLIRGVHTITGDGGAIHMDGKPIIDHHSDPGPSTDHLTTEGSCTSTLVRDCSLAIHGDGQIRVPMENNAFVIADAGVMCLNHHQKTGECEGFWMAEGGGTLLVQTLMTGTATWMAQDTDLGLLNGGNIIIGEDAQTTGCVAAEGDVIVTGQGASLFVSEHGYFCTSGALVHRSLDNGMAGPTAPVAEAVVLSYFGVSGCDAVNCP